MPVDLNKLKQMHDARKALNDAGASIVFRAEMAANITYFIDKNIGDDLSDFELAFLGEMLNIWQEKDYDTNKSLPKLNPFITRNKGDLKTVLDRLKSIKNDGKTATEPDQFYKTDRGLELLKYREWEEKQTEADLKQTRTERDTAKADLKTANDKITELNKWPQKFPNETIDTAFGKYSEPKEKHKDEDIAKLQTASNNLTNLLNSYNENIAKVYGLSTFDLTKFDLKKLDDLTTHLSTMVNKTTENSKWKEIAEERTKTITALNADSRIKDLEERLETQKKTIDEWDEDNRKKDKEIENLKKRIKELESNQHVFQVEINEVRK